MNYPAFPTTLTLPDYAGGSIVNLMASIASALGVAHWPYAPLRLLDVVRLGRRRNILLLVVDGLGYRYLCDAHPRSTLRQYLQGSMTSVFPSTTATAITALMTGLAPRQHGLTGWHIYFEEIGAVGAVLPFRLRATDERLAQFGLQPATVFPYPSFFDRVPVQTFVVSPASIVHSEFNTAHSGRAQRTATDRWSSSSKPSSSPCARRASASWSTPTIPSSTPLPTNMASVRATARRCCGASMTV